MDIFWNYTMSDKSVWILGSEIYKFSSVLVTFQGIRKVILDADKIEQVLHYWKVSFSKSVSNTLDAHCRPAV